MREKRSARGRKTAFAGKKKSGLGPIFQSVTPGLFAKFSKMVNWTDEMTIRVLNAIISAKEAGLLTADNGIKNAAWVQIHKRYTENLPATCEAVDVKQIQNKVNTLKKKYTIFMVSFISDPACYFLFECSFMVSIISDFEGELWFRLG
jgi:hypothetical protein